MSESVVIKDKSGMLDRPDEFLHDVGSLAWQAYNAMETTKRRHFDFLEVLDNKKKNYNIDPTEKDTQLLACLLKDHDEQVKRFTRESKALKEANLDAHAGLFMYISDINHATEEHHVTH